MFLEKIDLLEKDFMASRRKNTEILGSAGNIYAVNMVMLNWKILYALRVVTLEFGNLNLSMWNAI